MQVAKAIIDPTPEWFLDTIRVVAIPRLRREIEGYAHFPDTGAIRERIVSTQRQAKTLLRSMSDRVIWNLIIQHWRLRENITMLGNLAEGDLVSGTQDDDIWHELKAADKTQRQSLLNGLAHLPIVLQRALDALPSYSRAKPHPDTPTPHQSCAIWIVIAWKTVHDREAPHTSRKAQSACSALWSAAGGSSRAWGAGGGWKDHLRAAKARQGSELFELWQRNFLNVKNLREK
jgi:hypothetical protein